MREPRESKGKGLSLKAASFMMLTASVVIAIMLLIASTRTFRSFRRMEKVTNNYIELQEATAELMSASDYLKEEVQCYTVIGERQQMDNYFTEAETVRRREHAIAIMEEELPDSAALLKLKKSMSESLSLMDREYYAMRLMMEAKGETDYPAAISGMMLSDADRRLNAQEKKELARIIPGCLFTLSRF